MNQTDEEWDVDVPERQEPFERTYNFEPIVKTSLAITLIFVLILIIAVCFA